MRAFVVAATLVLVGCSLGGDAKLAEQAVPRFHQMLDAGQFDVVYADAADELKRASSRQDFVALLEVIHRKLGNSKTSTRQGWNVNYRTSGTFVMLTYATVYDQGDAAEQFVYRLVGEKALLVGYHVNSNALILR